MAVQPERTLPLRGIAMAWGAMLLIAVLAWTVTVAQTGRMGIGAGTMGLTFPFFLGFWVMMMAAMMLPSVAPVAITWARAIGRQSTGVRRALRVAQFVCGYLIAWAAHGILVFAALTVTGRLVEGNEQTARWIGAAVFLLAGLQQLGPLKDVCLRHCRSPLMHLLHYAGFRGRARDLRVGVHHGLYCVGCCWGLMVLLVPLGVMNVAAMAVLAAVIFLEKLWRHGPVLARVTGVAFLVLAALAPFQPWLLPGLHASGMSM